MKKERLVYINVGLPTSYVDAIDKTRKTTPVSEFIRDFLVENKDKVLKTQIA